MTPILHLIPATHADPAQWPDGRLAPDSLATEGFVHASGDEATLLAVANTLYRDATEPLVALVIDPERVDAEVRWEAPHPVPPAGVSPDTLFPHVYGPIPAAAVVGHRYLRPSPHGGFTAVEERPATAELLDLAPHPEGGWFRQTWRTDHTVTPEGYSGTRATATGILFLLPVGEESRWHTVRSAEMWVFNRGGPLELLLGGTGADPGEPTMVRLGTDVEGGQHTQHVVPGGHWQAARPAGTEEVLVTCVVSPGFDFADFAVEADDQATLPGDTRNSVAPVETERLRLRPYLPGDEEWMYRVYSNPDVARYLLDEPWTKDVAAQRLEERLPRTDLDGEAGALALVIEHDNTPIGDVALWYTDREHRVAEIGWVLDPEHGGRGFAGEAVRAVLDLAFERYRTHRVVAQMDARNTASASLATRVGMRREAHLRQDWWSKGEWTDSLIFALLAADREG